MEMQKNKYSIADDAIQTTKEIRTDRLWKYAPIAAMFMSASNKALINSNPVYADYKKFYIDWNIPSFIQEIGKAKVSANAALDDVAKGELAWAPTHSFKGVYDNLCPIEPSFFDYAFNEVAKIGQMIDSPLAIAGIMTSASACTLAILSKMKAHESDVRPLTYYKNKSWETLQKHIDKGDEQAFRSAYHEMVGGSSGLVMSLKKSRAVYRRAENIIRNLEFEDLLSFKLIGDLSTVITGNTYRREEYLRNLSSSILGSTKMEIAALLDELEPAIFSAAAKHGYSFQSVINTYIDLANNEFKKDLSFSIISSKSNAYDKIIKSASELQSQHLVYEAFSNLVAKAYKEQGEVKQGIKGREVLDQYIEDIKYFSSISSKIVAEQGVFDNLESAASSVCEDLKSLSTDNYLALVGRSGDYHTLRSNTYSDPDFFFDNAVKKMIPNCVIGKNNTTADYLTIALKDYVSKHFEKQKDNRNDRDGVSDYKLDSDEVALDKVNDRQRAFADNSLSIAVGMNVAANIIQAGSSAKDADYISAPINAGSLLTEAFTFIRSPDVVKENFSKAVDAISTSTVIALPAIASVASLIVASAGQYLAVKEKNDEHFNIERTQSWKSIKKYLSKEDKALNNIFNHQMDNNIRRHFSKARYSKLFESIKEIDPGAMCPLAIIAQAYKDTGDEKLFKRYVKNIVSLDDFKAVIVDNTEMLISEYAKRTNPKSLIEEVVSALNEINTLLDDKMIIADTSKLNEDISAQTERLTNVHMHSKAFTGAVSAAFATRIKMDESLLRTRNLEDKLKQAENSPQTLETRILIHGYNEQIQTENRELEWLCSRFSESFTDINTFAHAKKVFGDKNGEYQPLQTLASLVVNCEFNRDYSELSELIGVEITPEILSDRNMMFKEIVVPFSVKSGVNLKHDATGWDYFGKVVAETINPYVTKDIKQDKRMELDKTFKDMKRNTLARQGAENSIYESPIFCM